MAQHLTDATVKRLPLPERASKIHPDGDVPGFGCRVTAAGARSFVLRYRVRGSGRERTYTIGSTGNWQITAARAEAKRLRRLIDEGGDPLGDIEAKREAPILADLIERFVTEHVEPRLRPNTVRHYKMLIRRHMRPNFGAHVRVADISYEDVDRLHRKISKDGGPYAAPTAPSASCGKCSPRPSPEHATTTIRRGASRKMMRPSASATCKATSWRG